MNDLQNRFLRIQEFELNRVTPELKLQPMFECLNSLELYVPVCCSGLCP